MSGISLTASMRSNLLSLQNIASRQDIVQNRLATGLKVSSAIDNPSSYYTASSLNNRAADLTALLDAMSQGIQTIKAASEAINSGTKFLEQAKAVANQALETAQPVIARVCNEEQLRKAITSSQKGFIILENDITINNPQSLELKDGQSLVGKGYFDNKKNNKITFNYINKALSGIIVNGNSTIANLDIVYNNNKRDNKAAIEIMRNSANVTIQDIDITTNVHTGLPVEENTPFSGILNNSVKLTILAGTINIRDTLNINESARGHALYRGNYKISQNTQLNLQTTGRDSYGFADLTLKAYDNAKINIKTIGTWGEAARLSTIDFYNNSELNYQHQASSSYALLYGKYNFHDSSKLNIDSVYDFTSASSGDLQTGINITSAQVTVHIKAKHNSVYYLSAVAGTRIIMDTGIFTAKADVNNLLISKGNFPVEYFSFDNTQAFTMPPSFNTMMANFEKYSQDTAAKNTAKNFFEENKDFLKYQEIIKQYDMLISDASYKGINLLEGQYLKINFNEDRSSKIDVPGVKADSESLGLKTKEWQTAEDVEKSVSELEEAINSLRSFASEFGNYYSIVTTRQDFTENLINVLEEGADKLTLADMNQESANMLALQTAQQLAVNSLSLASQASQSILKLF